MSTESQPRNKLREIEELVHRVASHTDSDDFNVAMKPRLQEAGLLDAIEQDPVAYTTAYWYARGMWRILIG